MCSQLTLGSTQPGEKPVTVHSGDALSTRQLSIKGHSTEEIKRYDWGKKNLNNGSHDPDHAHREQSVTPRLALHIIPAN